MNDPKLFRTLGHSLIKWAEQLTLRVGPEESARLLFAVGIAQMVAATNQEATAAFLRDLADTLEDGDRIDGPTARRSDVN
jgi:hypothetical protein